MVSEKTNRKFILNVSKYQKHIIYPILASCWIAGIMVYLCLEFIVTININPNIAKMFSFDTVQIQQAIPYFLMIIIVMLIFIILWAYYKTNKIIGPHDRIIRELDEIIVGKRKGPLTVRQGDDMFGELLERINTIIEKP
jgi:hypothetical protein